MEIQETVPTMPKYLKEQIDIIARKVNFTEYTVHADSGSNHGDGFMAAMIGITLRGKRNHNGSKMNYELPLICKLMPDNVTRRETFNSVVLFEREVYFYKEILPIFINFLKEKKIHVDEEFAIYPKCFAALSEPKLDQYLIIMENLKTLGYELWDKKVPIDFDSVAYVLTELGKLHAISFAIRDQRKEIFDKMFRLREPFQDMFKGNGLPETMVSGAIQQTIDILDNKAEIKVMENVKDKYEVWIKDLLKEDAAGRFGVLNHGDLWNNNMMFTLEPNNQQRKLRLVDFQLLRLASPVIDISYYFCTSTNPDIHQRYNELLHIYYNSLATFLSKMGSDPQKLFTFNDLTDQFKQFGKYGLIFSPILVGVMVSDSGDILDMNSINEDSKATGLATLNEKTKILLKERMSSVIQLAMKKGYFISYGGHFGQPSYEIQHFFNNGSWGIKDLPDMCALSGLYVCNIYLCNFRP